MKYLFVVFGYTEIQNYNIIMGEYNMYLKKIIKNNKGVDVSLIGTAWILVLIVSIAAILDLFIITYSKESVIMATKSMQIYSLTSNFDADFVFLEQIFHVGNNSQQAIIETFKSQWNRRFGSVPRRNAGGRLSKNTEHKGLITNLTHNDNITVTVSDTDRSIVLTVPNITFRPRQIIKTTTKIPFFGGTTENYSNAEIRSGVSTKLKVLVQ